MPTLPLGYDIRLCADAYLAEFWNDDRRQHFLLRPDVEWPLSFDPIAWPSIFRSPDVFQVPGAEDWWPDRPPAIIAGFENKRYDTFMDLWPGLDEMLAAFRKHAWPGACGVPVAVDMIGDTTPKSDLAPSPEFDTQVSVQSRPGDWVLLGYDVCDFGWISGLSNCGTALAEMQKLSREWNDRLNEFGLFLSAGDAGKFCRVTDRRVPEHAPFRVFALYRAPNDEQK